MCVVLVCSQRASQVRRPYIFRRDRPSISAQMEESKAHDLSEMKNPLLDVLFAGNAPENDPYVRAVRGMIEPTLTAKGVQWLDSAKPVDRQLLGDVFEFCGKLFVSLGTEPHCIVQCQPSVDCGLQAARNCQPFKRKLDEVSAAPESQQQQGAGGAPPGEAGRAAYEEYVRCTDRERRFCHRYGKFSGEKYPNRKIGATETRGEKMEKTVERCATLFQMRGLKVPCLRECTVFQMRNNRPDEFFFWKAKQKFKYDKGIAADQRDPSLPKSFAQGVYNDCEHVSLTQCKWVKKDFWRECYERVKMGCLERGAPENTVMPRTLPSER